MPLYEYECTGCDKIHEIMQKFSDPPLGECPDCNAPVSKLMSLSSFSLKGSGWYTSDYKRSGKKESPKTGPESQASSTSPASSDTASSANPVSPTTPASTS